ncbi:FAD dependent oxidoreductase [Fusarium pseudocircinatum]|uniref:FAD dependent oxidoreductase n=1 Tax=Fusarium pseudocircinatum TaxID=56676 RepID=A0A8H5PVU0_9HYPO|nr:FAD dependent oxidoreductase [Fusarium pseudocircinatum]
MSPSPLPVDNATTPFWRSEPHPLDNHRSTPDLPAQVDIAIIGAGYAGVATVYHILEQCKARGAPAPRIVILEARQACSGATGRNGGHLKPDPYNRPAGLLATYGIEAAAEAAEFEAKNLAAVKKVIEKEGVDCDFVYTRAVDALMSDDILEKIKSGVDALRQNGVSVMQDVYFAQGAEAEQLSGVKGAKGCFSYTAGHCWPYKLILQLLSKAVDANVSLQTNTPVTAVTAKPDKDGHLTLTTPRGSIRAAKIIYATNAYTSSILPEFVDKIVPNNVNDDKLIESAKNYFDGYMQRVFHGWEGSGAYTSKVWTGVMGYSSDGLPHIGAVPGRRNQYMLAGFTGHGMPQIFLSAKGVASMVMEGLSYEKTGIPKLYKASQERLDSPNNTILDTWKTVQRREGAKL